MYDHKCQEPDETYCALSGQIFDHKNRVCAEAAVRVLNIIPRELEVYDSKSCAGSKMDSFSDFTAKLDMFLNVMPAEAVDADNKNFNGHVKILKGKSFKGLNDGSKIDLTEYSKKIRLIVRGDSGNLQPLKFEIGTSVSVNHGHMGSTSDSFSYLDKSQQEEAPQEKIDGKTTIHPKISNYVTGIVRTRKHGFYEEFLKHYGCRLSVKFDWYWTHPSAVMDEMKDKDD